MKPILFNTQMVRAILDGQKIETRRVRKVNHETGEVEGAKYREGDILYVREAYCRIPVSPGGHMRINGRFYYKADADARPERWRGKWKPSIHMPKEAARIFLRITDYYPQRLQDISSASIEREGCKGTADNAGYIIHPRKEFIDLWNSTIKAGDLDKYGWNANLIVWVYEFERISKEEVQ